MNVTNLSFGYRDEKFLFENLNLDLTKGSFMLVKGPSGCGKSTLLKLIAGFLNPQKGKINIEDRKTKIGYLHQDCHLIEHWTVWENLSLVNSEIELAKKFLQEFGLNKVFNNLVSELSGGEKQRVSLARILLQNPDLLLLDEPSAHLDDKNTVHIIGFIKKYFKDKIVIVVSHDRRLDELASQIFEWTDLVRNGV